MAFHCPVSRNCFGGMYYANHVSFENSIATHHRYKNIEEYIKLYNKLL